MSDKLDTYFKEKIESIKSYTLSHSVPYNQGLPVNIDDIPKTIDDAMDLMGRLVYIDQQKIIEKLQVELKQKDEKLLDCAEFICNQHKCVCADTKFCDSCIVCRSEQYLKELKDGGE